jgi:hypothetical protein
MSTEKGAQMRKFCILIAVYFSTSGYTLAFSEDAVRLASQPVMNTVVQAFSDMLEPLTYGECWYVNSLATIMYERGELDVPTQATYILMGRGLDRYRNEFYRQYGSTAVLEQVLSTMDGMIFNSDMTVPIARCSIMMMDALSSARN